VARYLAPRFRVLRFDRRPYRVPGGAGLAETMQNEVSDVLAIAAFAGGPLLLAAGQISDDIALESLGVGIGRYAHLGVPALLLGGAKSPEHLHVRLDALARVLPRLESVVILKGQGHIANARAPAKVARIIETFADTVMP